MRLIDADAMHKFVEDKVAEGKDGWAYGVPYEWAYALTAADMQPAIDAIEVVRCKDCKWYGPDTDWGFDEATGKRDHSKIVKKPYGECHGQNFHFTEDGFLRVGDDDFCSYGERAEYISADIQRQKYIEEDIGKDGEC